VCDTGGLALPGSTEAGEGDGTGHETIGDAVADGILGSPLGNVGGLIQDPGQNNTFGPVSGALYSGFSTSPASGLGNELACLVNVVGQPTPTGL
jgi:hypothetical protein